MQKIIIYLWLFVLSFAVWDIYRILELQKSIDKNFTTIIQGIIPVPRSAQ